MLANQHVSQCSANQAVLSCTNRLFFFFFFFCSTMPAILKFDSQIYLLLIVSFSHKTQVLSVLCDIVPEIEIARDVNVNKLVAIISCFVEKHRKCNCVATPATFEDARSPCH